MAAIERGGVASFFVDGAYCQVKSDISIKLGGIIRVAKTASDSVAGTTTKYIEPQVTLTALDGPAVSVTALKAINGQTVQIKMNNGKIYQLIGAFQVDDPDIKIDEGEIGGLKLSGQRCQEIRA